MATLIPKYELTGQTTVNRPINDKLAESVSVEDFDGATDTLKVQAAFDSGLSIVFTKNYSVDTVTISSIGQTIDFNGYSLIGTRDTGSATAQFVLAITGRELTLYNVNVNVNFKNYTSGVRWYSVSSGAPAQYNKVYGMRISNAVNGLIYGQEAGSTSVDAAQSENTIYSLTFRAVQICFTGNQSNGFLTLVSPSLDCNPYEWTSQPGYNATTWQTAALALQNPANALSIIGGEILKTSSQLGYGVSGNSFLLSGVTLEMAGNNFYIDGGGVTIRDTFNFYMASDSANIITLATTIDGTNARPIVLDNCTIERGNNVGSYSGNTLVKGTTTTPIVIYFNNCKINNWSAIKLINSSAAQVGALQVSNAIGRFTNTYTINYDGSGVLTSTEVLANSNAISFTTVASASTIETWNAGNVMYISGTTAINTINPPYQSFRGSLTFIPTGIFTTTTAGNVKIASTAVVGKALTMIYDGTFWYPSY